ncbi:DUF5683 domain-containing protein [Aquimarina agarilytica]|uniref:DUF5683 domain-containing protein n=1 Tax=Aquimarina agarilytica TaxID=1087449 RepID=UPI0002E41AE4|nr:DUF5683 domain-containing protein [Aquimarina agarilytica]
MLAQEKDSLSIVSVDSVAVKKNLKKLARIKRRKIRQQKNIRPYNALAPSKAAFYSAVLPGLGQAYTGKYWKIPIVYGALGTGIGITLWNKNNHDEIRDIFKNRLRGITTDRFYDQENDRAILSNNGLIEAQRQFRKQQELSILITVGLYVLNIVDANVTAHLQQYNLNKKLSFSPKIEFDTPTAQANYGMVLQYSF